MRSDLRGYVSYEGDRDTQLGVIGLACWNCLRGLDYGGLVG